MATDDEDALYGPGAMNLEKVGVIELKVELVRYGAPKKPKNSKFFAPKTQDDAFSQRVVHETSKKLGGHQASYVHRLCACQVHVLSAYTA